MYSRTSTQTTAETDANAEGEASAETEKGPMCVTVQLEEGIFVVRMLRCGLLLVAVGPDEAGEVESVKSGSASVGAGVRRVGEEVGRVLEGRLGALRVPGDVVEGD